MQLHAFQHWLAVVLVELAATPATAATLQAAAATGHATEHDGHHDDCDQAGDEAQPNVPRPLDVLLVLAQLLQVDQALVQVLGHLVQHAAPEHLVGVVHSPGEAVGVGWRQLGSGGQVHALARHQGQQHEEHEHGGEFHHTGLVDPSSVPSLSLNASQLGSPYSESY